MPGLSSDHKLSPGDASGLDTLLSLAGDIYEMGGGYWVEIKAQRVPPDIGRPKGVAYSLTLHSPEGVRLLGYDNAHAVRASAGPAGAARPPFDHEHRGEQVRPYSYTDAFALLSDFWQDVESILKEEGVS